MPKMKVFTSLKSLESYKEVPEYQLYIYVIENSEGKIKIGRTTNPLKRLTSLSGSNGGGAEITRFAVMDEPTYVLTLEESLHTHYNFWRITGTEWFRNLDFNEVVDYVNMLLSSKGYETCTEVRQDILRKENKLPAQKFHAIQYDPFE